MVRWLSLREHVFMFHKRQLSKRVYLVMLYKESGIASHSSLLSIIIRLANTQTRPSILERLSAALWHLHEQQRKHVFACTVPGRHERASSGVNDRIGFTNNFKCVSYHVRTDSLYGMKILFLPWACSESEEITFPRVSKDLLILAPS